MLGDIADPKTLIAAKIVSSEWNIGEIAIQQDFGLPVLVGLLKALCYLGRREYTWQSG
jgi:hypothetical protein